MIEKDGFVRPDLCFVARRDGRGGVEVFDAGLDRYVPIERAPGALGRATCEHVLEAWPGAAGGTIVPVVIDVSGLAG